MRVLIKFSVCLLTYLGDENFASRWLKLRVCPILCFLLNELRLIYDLCLILMADIMIHTFSFWASSFSRSCSIFLLDSSACVSFFGGALLLEAASSVASSSANKSAASFFLSRAAFLFSSSAF